MNHNHRLLVFQQIGLRMRPILLVFGVILLAVGLYDQFTGYLGQYWYWWWLAIALLVILWSYYSLLMPRAAIKVKAKTLRLQGPIWGYNISYGRVYAITASKMDQQYPFDQLKGSERAILKPFYHKTCVFIELTSYPRALKWRRLWFPRYLFGANRMGLICHVEDWMALSRDLESSRANRQEVQEQTHITSRQTLVGRILAEDLDFQ